MPALFSHFPHCLVQVQNSHLIAKPWLADIIIVPQDLTINETVIGEPAIQTMHGLFMLLNNLVEAAALCYLSLWEKGKQGQNAAPSTAWDQTFDFHELKFRGIWPHADQGRLDHAVSLRDSARVARQPGPRPSPGASGIGLFDLTPRVQGVIRMHGSSV